MGGLADWSAETETETQCIGSHSLLRRPCLIAEVRCRGGGTIPDSARFPLSTVRILLLIFGSPITHIMEPGVRDLHEIEALCRFVINLSPKKVKV